MTIRNAALQLFSPTSTTATSPNTAANTASTSMFTARFYIHKKLATSDGSAGGGGFRLDEVTWHRRIQSAPESHVTIGDEEEGSVIVEPSNVPSPECANSMSSLSTSGTSLLTRRGLNLPSPTRDHQRSKTANCAAEAMVSQPIKHGVPLGAPSPVKDWATAFTPSYIVPSSAAPPAALFFPPPEPVPQPPQGLDVYTPPVGMVEPYAVRVHLHPSLLVPMKVKCRLARPSRSPSHQPYNSNHY